MAGVMWLFRSMFLVIPAIIGIITFGAVLIALRVLDDDERKRLLKVFRR